MEKDANKLSPGYLISHGKDNEYNARVLKHYEIQNEVALELLQIAQRLCPGTWVLEIRAGLNFENKKHEVVFHVSVTNGDDNVSTTNKNLGAAIAQLIYYLLNGSVFPLTGGGGQYVHPLDAGYTLKGRIMFGLSDIFVNAHHERFPEDRPDRLQEELAELIVACSKIKRYGSDSGPAFRNLKEEMADVLITMAALAKSLDISETEILEEANIKAAKYKLPSVWG